MVPAEKKFSAKLNPSDYLSTIGQKPLIIAQATRATVLASA